MLFSRTFQGLEKGGNVQELSTGHPASAASFGVTEMPNARFAGARYLPVLMQQTKIYWDRDNFMQVEKIFRKSVEFCNDQDTWKLNVAHVLFMQETKYKEAAGFYEPIVKKHYENVQTFFLLLWFYS